MRILIVRHGDPDYAIDSLTEKGWKEAKLVADRISKMDIKYKNDLSRQVVFLFGGIWPVLFRFLDS